MGKLNMTKQKIIILAVSVAVVIAGSIAAVAIIRNVNKNKESTTTSATVSQYDYNNIDETYYVDVPEVITDENHSAVTDVSGNVLTTIKKVVKTSKKVVTTKKTATTKKANAAAGTTSPGLINNMIGSDGKQVFGYRYDEAGNYYYTDDKDCWQKNAGYNEIYDNMANGILMIIDQVRIRFTYGGKDWMIQFWKGQYGMMVGAEIGVYTAKEGTYTGATGDVNHYNCADKEDWLKMQLDCYWDKNGDGHYEKIFTRPYDYYWWATGFINGRCNSVKHPIKELKVKGRITFKSQEMADLFVIGLRQSGFKRSANKDNLVDDSYYQSGKDVWVLWSTAYHDSFVGYEGRTTTTTTKKATTTTTKKETTTTTTKKPTTTTTTQKPTETTTTTAVESTTEAKND